MMTLEQALAEPPPPPLIHYPESDGKPMGDNDWQRDWIVKIIENLRVLFAERSDVYVTGDLFWYPVEGNNRIVQAPDAMVVFGRPSGSRACYKQWEEANTAPHVVFEVLSPSNTPEEMVRKRAFYQRYGVEECYLITPETNTAEGWLRSSSGFEPIGQMNSWRSPKLGISFHSRTDCLELRYPNGQPFAEFADIVRQRDEAQAHARQESERAKQESERARHEAERAERLAAKLRELGIDPDAEE